MAQADSGPSSTRQLITGEATNQSTNLRAVNLPAVRVQPVDRRYFIDGSDARVIINTDEAPLFWFRRERRPDVELEDLSNCRWYAASQEPLGLEHRGSVLRDHRLSAGAVAPEHSYSASVPEQE